MSVPLNVLWIGLSEQVVWESQSWLQKQDFDLTGEQISMTEFSSATFLTQRWDVMISNHCLPNCDAFAALKILQHSLCNLPFIVIADPIGERAAVDLIKAGANDYLTLNEIDRLPDVVRWELQQLHCNGRFQNREAELQLSDARIAATFNQTVVGFAESNMTTGMLTLVNACFSEMTGYTQDELLDMTVADLSHPEDISASNQAIQKLRAGEVNAFTLEKRYQRKNGSFFWAHTTTYLVYLPGESDPRCFALIQDISDRKQAETLIQNLGLGTAATISQDFFSALVRYLAIALKVSSAWVTEKVSDDSLRTLAYWANGDLQPNYSYHFVDTPCERVLENGDLSCLDSVQDVFPDNEHLAELDAQGYVGIALYASSGDVIGHLCILNHEPLQNLTQVQYLLRVFAARAAAEIDRQRATVVLEQLNHSLELKVKERTKALAMTQAAVDLAADCIFLIQADGSFYYANHMAHSALGYHQAELLTLAFPDIAPTISMEVWRENWLTLKQQRAITLESYFQGKDGHCFPVELIINHLQVSGQEYAFAFVRDITERRQSQRISRLLANVVESTDDAIMTQDLEGYITSWNPAAEKLFGYSEAEVLGQPISIIFPPDRHTEEAEMVAYLNRGERMEHVETVRLRKDKTLFEVSISASLLHDELGNLVGTSAIVRDISARRQAERDNQKLRERLQFLLASNPAVIFSAEPYGDFRLTYLSENIEALSGHKPEYFFADPLSWEKQVHPDDAPRLYSAFVSLFEQEVYQHEYRFLHRDGHYIWVRNGLKLVRDQQGQPVEMIGYAVDISDLKEAELELTETNQALARVTRLKDEFLANMSHELRTPLNAILGMTEGLSEEVFGAITSEQLNALQVVERSSQHLLSLINEILDVARIESGQLELELRPVSVAHLFQSSLALVQQQAHKKQIQIETHLPSFLPDVCVDELRMVQSLINLLDNAVKFTMPGQSIVLDARLVVHSSPDLNRTANQSCLISIKDTGIGIAPEHLDTLFQPFVQIDSALNRKYSGTGLGLALVRRIVELHQGRVSVTSVVGAGSCFTIEIPYLDISESDDDCAILDLSAPLESSQESPLLLLAEDNEANIVTLLSYLKARGYRLEVAKDGLEAIAMVDSVRPHLVLMDIQMPQMDGLEAITMIRKNPAHANLPIIALTALAMPGDRDRCLTAGADTYVSKPIQMRKLTTTIEKLLTCQYV